jgi:hypothetical protein
MKEDKKLEVTEVATSDGLVQFKVINPNHIFIEKKPEVLWDAALDTVKKYFKSNQ